MTADIVNLRRARKQKARDTRHAQAAENRARFGRNKQARALEDANADLARRKHDQLKLDRTPIDDEGS